MHLSAFVTLYLHFVLSKTNMSGSSRHMTTDQAICETIPSQKTELQ